MLPLYPEGKEVKDSDLYFRFWGVRGSIPTPGLSTVYYGGNTSCVEVSTGGESIILDAGSGIRGLGHHLVKKAKGSPIDVTILITHTHWDHIQGFPFFSPAYNPANQIRVLGYKGAREGFASILEGQMERPYFPVTTKQMSGHLQIEELTETSFTIGKVPIRSKFLNHPGICAGYKICSASGTLAYLPDNEPIARVMEPFQACRGEISDMIGGRDEKLVEYLKGVDTVIMDAQYDEEEYASHVGWGHGCVVAVTNLAIDAGVRNLFLFHHDPQHDDQKIVSMVSKARQVVTRRKATMQVRGAREGEAFLMRGESSPLYSVRCT